MRTQQPISLDQDNDNAIADLGIPSLEAFERLSQDIGRHTKALIDAAKNLEALISPQVPMPGLDEPEAEDPLLYMKRWINDAVSDRWGHPDANQLPADIIRQAVQLLVPLTPIEASVKKGGKPPTNEGLQAIVRAVGVYAEKHPKLNFERSWDSLRPDPNNTGQRGGVYTPLPDDALEPTTNTALLIDAIAREILPDASRSSMRSQLFRFNKRIGTRAPAESDLQRIIFENQPIWWG